MMTLIGIPEVDVRALRVRNVLLSLLAGATFLLPLHRLAILGQSSCADLLLKRFVLHPPKRLRLTLLPSPCLTWGEDQRSSGRERPAEDSLRAVSCADTSSAQRPDLRSVATSTIPSVFPLRC
jgi:hypothetical protein